MPDIEKPPRRTARDIALDSMPDHLKSDVLQIAADHGVSGADDPGWLFVRSIRASSEVRAAIADVGVIIRDAPAAIQDAGVRASNELIATMRKIAAAPVVDVDISKIETRIQKRVDEAADLLEKSSKNGLADYKSQFLAYHAATLASISVPLRDALDRAAIDAMTNAYPRGRFVFTLIVGAAAAALIAAAALWGAAGFYGLPIGVRIDLLNLAKQIFLSL